MQATTRLYFLGLLVLGIVQGSAQPSFSFFPRALTYPMQTEFCVDLTTNDFTDINQFQFDIKWDETILTFTRLANLSVPGLIYSNFDESRVAEGALYVKWIDSAGIGVTLADGSRLLQYCFRTIGDCGTFSSIGIDESTVFITRPYASTRNIGTDFPNNFSSIVSITPEEECIFSCPAFSLQSTDDIDVCADEPLPSLSVLNTGLNPSSEIRWYRQATEGVPIATGLSYSPSEAGRYYVEIYDLNQDCASPRRAITLSIIECMARSEALKGARAASFNILDVHPNPFKDETTIVFQQTSDDWVEVMLYDVAGRMLYQQQNYHTAGTHEWKIDGNTLGENGIYFYRIQSPSESVVGKLILQR